MRLGIIKSTESIEPTGGIKIQGIMWKQGLESLGHEVVLIDFWNNYKWDSFDVIIIMDFGGMMRTMIPNLRKCVKKLILAPIIDPKFSLKMFLFFSKLWGSHKYLGLSSKYRDLYDTSKYFDLFLARSNYEASYINYCLGVDKNKIAIVPLSIRIPICNTFPQKEDFCFHASRLAAPNKNVKRLIEAAKKYQFNLVLAGHLNGFEEEEWLNKNIKDCSNITYVGTLTDNELIEFYKRAKVFALPSILEGVGMVALEAASNGCEIVLTQEGAPKDYYKGQAYLVNPYSIDDIGKKITQALQENKYQPRLMHFINENYHLETCCLKLVDEISKH